MVPRMPAVDHAILDENNNPLYKPNKKLAKLETKLKLKLKITISKLEIGPIDLMFMFISTIVGAPLNMI